MIKEWFIFINGIQQGPYTLLELRHHDDVTPDTLVWKEGFVDWIPIRNVPELKEIFKDEQEPTPIEIKGFKKKLGDLNQDQEALALQRDPTQFFLWLVIILLFIIYTILQFNRK